MDETNQDVLILRRGTVEALGDHVAAAVFDRIKRMCGEGEWKVSMADLAEAVWLSPSQARRAVSVLLDKGWVAVRRESSYDRSGIYSVPERPTTDGHLSDSASA